METKNLVYTELKYMFQIRVGCIEFHNGRGAGRPKEKMLLVSAFLVIFTPYDTVLDLFKGFETKRFTDKPI